MTPDESVHLDTAALNTIQRQCNLRMAWRLQDQEQWTEAQREQLRAAAFMEWGQAWEFQICL